MNTAWRLNQYLYVSLIFAAYMNVKKYLLAKPDCLATNYNGRGPGMYGADFVLLQIHVAFVNAGIGKMLQWGGKSRGKMKRELCLKEAE